MESSQSSLEVMYTALKVKCWQMEKGQLVLNLITAAWHPMGVGVGDCDCGCLRVGVICVWSSGLVGWVVVLCGDGGRWYGRGMCLLEGCQKWRVEW